MARIFCLLWFLALVLCKYDATTLGVVGWWGEILKQTIIEKLFKNILNMIQGSSGFLKTCKFLLFESQNPRLYNEIMSSLSHTIVAVS